MHVQDYARHEALTFVDFMEALGRVALMKELPSQEELLAGRCGLPCASIGDFARMVDDHWSLRSVWAGC